VAFRRDVLPPSSCEFRIALQVGNRTSSGQSYKNARQCTTTVCRRVYGCCQEVSGSVLRPRCGLVGPVLESRLEIFVFCKTSGPAPGTSPSSCRIGTGFISRVGEVGNWPECDVSFHFHLTAEEKDGLRYTSPPSTSVP